MGKFKFIRPRGVWMFIDSHLHISPGFPDVRDRSFITSGGGGGAGFLKNRVYENFTPPPSPLPKKKNLSNKRFSPHGNDSWKILPHNPAHGWPGGWILEKFQGTTLGYGNYYIHELRHYLVRYIGTLFRPFSSSVKLIIHYLPIETRPLSQMS